MNGRRIFDWRFVAMFCVMLLVSVAAYTFIRRINQTDALVDIARQSSRTAAKQADELAELRAASKEQQALSARRSEVASRERDQLSHQVYELQKQLIALTTYLRQHNIRVPSSVASPRAGATRPKAPSAAPHRHPTSPGTPTPTGPSPDAPTDVCALVPALCDGFPLGLPPLLP